MLVVFTRDVIAHNVSDKVLLICCGMLNAWATGVYRHIPLELKARSCVAQGNTVR